MAEYIHPARTTSSPRSVSSTSSALTLSLTSLPDYYYGRSDKFRRAMLKDKRLAQLAAEHDGHRPSSPRREARRSSRPHGFAQEHVQDNPYNQGSDELARRSMSLLPIP